MPGASTQFGHRRPEGVATKLFVRAGGVQVKVEVTPVLRGCVYGHVRRAVSPAVEDACGYAEAQVVSLEDLFAGKMVAALDRQHPRDFFDLGALLANEGLTDALRTAFVAYLISHNRPVVEPLAPGRLDIEAELGDRFVGMTPTPVALADLLARHARG